MLAHNKPLIIFDLDGTLVRINTFHHWIIYCFARAVLRADFAVALRILDILRSRFSKKIDHPRFKAEILKLTANLPERSVVRFAKWVTNFTNQAVAEHLQQSVGCKVLATAAPECYVRAIAAIYEFDCFVAARDPYLDVVSECRGEGKKARLISELGASSFEYVTLFTDHCDDIPLMRLAHQVWLVNPTRRSLAQINNAKIKFRLL